MSSEVGEADGQSGTSQQLPPALASPPKRHVSVASGIQNEPPAIASLKHQLLLEAIEKSPRLRNDLDLVVIVQYLSLLESLSSVSHHALHYLATECTLLSLRDGDVFCYQEDPVQSDSSALVIIEGSLCGYVNKSFSQRNDPSESFSSWNARQNKRRGMLVDFGEIQATYASGALCGFDDLLVAGARSSSSAEMTGTWYRRRGTHAQEQTRAIVLKKDTLDRAAHRFGLVFERGALHSQREISSTDVSHIALFTPFSEPAKQALFHSIPRRLVPRGHTIFGSSAGKTSTITDFILVLSGQLDIYWTGDDAQPGIEASSPSFSNATPPSRGDPLVFQRTPLFSIRRGQTLGDQSLGLGLHALFTSPPLQGLQPPPSTSFASVPPQQQPANRLPIRIVSAEDTTEVLILTHSFYEEKKCEHHTLLSYAAQLSHQQELARKPSTTHTQTTLSLLSSTESLPSWALAFFPSKSSNERTLSDLQQLIWRLSTADSVVAKVLFQFPPMVLERICHAMELVHFDSTTPSMLLEEGADTDELYVVLHGGLRTHETPTGNGAVAKQDVYLPGDIFGLQPLDNQHPSQTRPCAVYADLDTLLLTVPRMCIERWLTPVKTELVGNAGSLFHEHALYAVEHAHHRFSSTNEKRKSLIAMVRRSSHELATGGTSNAEMAAATAAAMASANATCQLACHIDAFADLLKRMGFLTSIPKFLLCDLLAESAIVPKQVGEIVFHENEPTKALVVVLSGFLRVFSLENMGTTIDMFRKHPFCQFASLHHLLSKHHSPYDGEGGAAGHGGAAAASGGGERGAPSLLTRHRSAMYGVHLQSLHAHNAFRAGVLREHSQCPATVVAQTPCLLLVIDEAVYSQILKKHAPSIDLGRYEFHSTAAAPVPPPPAAAVEGSEDPSVLPLPLRKTSIAGGQRQCSTKPTPLPLIKYVESNTGSLRWLAGFSSTKTHLLLRQAKLLVLQPGERLMRFGDLIDHVFIVVSGGLALYVKQNHDRIASALDASQRSVRSLMLERNVTSNYSTTSHQLNYASSSSTSGGDDARRLHHKRAMLKQKVNRMVTNTAPTMADNDSNSLPSKAPSSSRGIGAFGHFVLAAVREEKRKSFHSTGGDATADPATQPKRSSPTAVARTFHAAVSRAALQHRLDRRRGDTATTMASPASHETHDLAADDGDAASSSRDSTLLCYLHAGDVYGEEALSQIVYGSPHSIFADTSVGVASLASPASSFLQPHAPATVELLCLHRQAFLDLQFKSDEELEHELRGRSKAVKTKWQLAEKSVQSARKSSMGSTTAATSKMPKLFDLFKNILNQRYYLTMRAIADVPLLSGLPDAVKREICMGARFEAIDRYSNAYKDDNKPNNNTSGGGGPAASSSTNPMSSTSSSTTDPSTATAASSRHRYYFVLSGRVGLFPKTALHGNNNSSSNNNTSTTLSSDAMVAGTNRHTATSGSVSSTTANNMAAPVNAHFASVAANMDSCLRDVRAGHGFGELEVLVADASRHHIFAIALETTKLLSLPGDLFVKFWPQVVEMQRHIEYLRYGVRFFQRLGMEKISYLYHALQHDSFDRNATILEQQQPLSKSELILVKEGECSIKNKVCVQARVNKGDSSRSHGEALDATSDDTSAGMSGGHRHVIRVLATIADVSAGHVFWLDGRHVPFTLQAISARVSIVRIPIDRLRMILPKAHVLQMEECSESLAALYRDQLAAARRTIVRVMNDKRQAELGRSTTENGSAAETFLPSLHFSLQTSTKKSQVALSGVLGSAGSNKSSKLVHASQLYQQQAQENRNEPSAIPYSRLLSSRPVDLSEIQTEDHERQRRLRAIQNQLPTPDQEGKGGVDGDGVAEEGPGVQEPQTELDVAYQRAHQSEHYQLADYSVSALPSATALRGSFPDDVRFRRSSYRSLRQKRSTTNIEPLASDLATMSGEGNGNQTAKLQELSVPEMAARSPPVQLQVRLPIAPPLGMALGRPTRPTTPVSAAVATVKPPASTLAMNHKNSFIVEYYGDPTDIGDSGGKEDDGGVDFVMDLRISLHQELQSPQSPLRSISLLPSDCKVHTLGKYIQQTPPPATTAALTATTTLVMALRSPRPPHYHVDTKVDLPRTPRATMLKTKPPHTRHLAKPIANNTMATQDFIVRKQGSLHVVVVPSEATIPGYTQDEFLRRVVHLQKRRVFRLEDHMLREYANDTARQDLLSVGQSQALRSYDLRQEAELRDAPTVSCGEEETILQHSFLLDLRTFSSSSGTVLLLTAESFVDKKSWMASIRAAAALGKPPVLVKLANQAVNGAPGSPKFRHRESVAMGLIHRENYRRLTQLTGGAAANDEMAQEDHVLEVEYRIS